MFKRILIKIKNFYQCLLKLIKKDKRIKITFEMKKELLEKGFHDDVIKMKRSYSILKNPISFLDKLEHEDIIFDDYFTAFLVRIRILYRFFNNLAKEDDKEAKVEDYIPGWKIKSKWKEMKFLYDQINAHLSHLDYSRIKTENRLIYETKKIYKYFRGVIINFLKDLQKTNYISGILKKLLKELERDVKDNP